MTPFSLIYWPKKSTEKIKTIVPFCKYYAAQQFFTFNVPICVIERETEIERERNGYRENSDREKEEEGFIYGIVKKNKKGGDNVSGTV